MEKTLRKERERENKRAAAVYSPPEAVDSVILYFILLRYYIILCYNILYYIAPRYILLYYFILKYIILH